MPMNTLVPVATTSVGAGLTVVGASAHAALGDLSDGTYLTGQVTPAESVRTAQHVGPGGLTPLPPTAWQISGAVFKVRGNKGSAGGVHVFGGEYPNNRIQGTPALGTPTTYTSASAAVWTTAAQVNAAGWIVGIIYEASPGVTGEVMEFSVDVTWEPAMSAIRGMIMGILGPLVAVGLGEMPKLARELFRRSGTRILPEEYARFFRALREDPGRVVFDLAPGRLRG